MLYVLAFILLVAGAILLASVARHLLLRPAGESGTEPAEIVEPTTRPFDPRPGNSVTEGKVIPTRAGDPGNSFYQVPPEIDQRSVPEGASSALERLYAANPPIHDYFFAAEELARTDYGERTGQAAPYRIGDRATFATNDGTRQAELVYMDDLATWWVEVGLTLDKRELAGTAERLRSRYYPLLVRNIGQEWRPGVDNDPRITILHILEPPETHELGYFTDENQYPRSLFGKSNEREMIYLNMSLLEQGPLYEGTLIHEVQHLIQWNLDANEDKWLNEGLSQVAETMAGLNTIDPRPYLEQTTMRLDRWSNSAPEINAHYAGAYLYLLYLWQQLGDAALTELARHPANGLSAVRSVLAGREPRRSLEEFTGDWAAALYLDGESNDPRYTIEGHDLGQPFLANRVRQLPFEVQSTLAQFAIDYIDLDFSGPSTITFAGDSVVELIDPPPAGEDKIWYALPANSSRSQLTAAVDLRGVTTANMDFYVWHDLEPDYDFAYIDVSTDNGRTWRLLKPEHATLGAYGPAWGGDSRRIIGNMDGWVEESINLNSYIGQSILLRFDVVTDFEQFGRGFALNGLNIPQLATQPEWLPDGFVETGHLLPQRWLVGLIRAGQTPVVLPLALDDLNSGQVTVELGPAGGVLAILPLTPFVETEANYWLSITN